MKESMPDVSFERSMNHNYMILSKCSFFGKDDGKSTDYRTKMLLENRIPGLLPVTHRLVNGESRYYYEINSLQSLDRIYDKTEIRYDELRRLLSGCVSLFDRLEEYLLDGTQIIMKSEMIYIDVEKRDPYFVCYPEYEGDVRLSFMEFVDGLLTRIDHTDDRAVMIGYQIYRYTRNPNYVISEIGAILEHAVAGMAHRENNLGQNNCGSHRADVGEDGVNKSDACCEVANRIGKRDALEVQGRFRADSFENEERETDERKTGPKTKYISNLIGGIFCVFVALCSGVILLGARMIQAFKLGGNNELYLYGAMGMAAAAAALFIFCYMKKRRQDKAEVFPDDGEDFEDIQYYTAAGSGGDSDNRGCHDSPAHGLMQEPHNLQGHIYTSSQPCNVPRSSGLPTPDVYNETVCLGNGVVEERMLCGRMNGKEVSVSLDRLPMTVGKLASVSDFVICDASVSKMHARFEERGGRIYVCDLNSTNGTVRNGELLEVNQSVALEPGDRLRFGRTSFTYS